MSLYHGPQNIITNGLRLYLDASRPDSYPGYGDKWYDLSGNDFHGYVVKTSDYPIFNTNYLTFNKTSYITLAGTSIPKLGVYDNSYACEALFSVNNTNTDNMIFGNISQGIVGAGWHLGTRSSTFYMGHLSADTSAAGVIANTIYHVMWVFDKGISTNNAKIWVNGNNLSSSGANIRSLISTNSVLICSGTDNTSTVFGGNIYYLKIYNRALSNNEVSQSFNAARTRYNL